MKKKINWQREDGWSQKVFPSSIKLHPTLVMAAIKHEAKQISLIANFENKQKGRVEHEQEEETKIN